MLIANPIYDVVFKRLMENDKVAKFFIGTLLDEVIENVEVKPQEFTYVNDLVGVAVFRLDFIATIKTQTGEFKKVLIEVQKARNFIDLMRFRNYLAEQYKKEDLIDNKATILPITTIYILGFNLPEIETPCLKIERNYKDLVNQQIILERSDFAEKLTHDSFIVQVKRITNRYQTKLDKLLSLFEQKYFLDDKKITKNFQHDLESDEDIKSTTTILHYVGTNPAERKLLEDEQEAWRSIDVMMGDLRSKMIESEKILKEKDKTINENKKVINEKDKALGEKDKALNENKKVINEKDKLIEELMRKLNEKK